MNFLEGKSEQLGGSDNTSNTDNNKSNASKFNKK